MCLTPNTLADRTLVACRGCKLCRKNRVNDLIGRCLAEQATSSGALAVTLTYAGDVPEAALLRYEDVQLFLKRLRKAGFKVRYIVAGEYGSKKGRAHWHIVLFFNGKVPDVEMNANYVEWSFWPHGYSYFQNADVKGFSYILKYVLKGEGPEAKTLSMSKKPPLGHEFFMNMAHDIVDRGLPVHSPEYSFSGIKTYQGKTRAFWLQGRMREMYLEEYCRYWQETYGNEPPLTEFLLERYLDPIARKEMELDEVRFQLRQHEKQQAYEKRVAAERADYIKRKAREIGIYWLQDISVTLTAFSDGTCLYDNGEDIWRLTFASASVVLNVAAQLQASGLCNSKLPLVLDWIQRMRGRVEPSQLAD